MGYYATLSLKLQPAFSDGAVEGGKLIFAQNFIWNIFVKIARKFLQNFLTI